MLLDDLLAQLAGVVGHEAGMAGDETEDAEVGALPLTPRAGQVNGFPPAAYLRFLLLDPPLRLVDVMPGFRHRYPASFAPRPFVDPVDGGAKLRELRLGTAHEPGTAETTLGAVGDLGPGNALWQTSVQFHPLRIIRIRLEFDPPLRHTITVPPRRRQWPPRGYGYLAVKPEVILRTPVPEHWLSAVISDCGQGTNSGAGPPMHRCRSAPPRPGSECHRRSTSPAWTYFHYAFTRFDTEFGQPRPDAVNNTRYAVTSSGRIVARHHQTVHALARAMADAWHTTPDPIALTTVKQRAWERITGWTGSARRESPEDHFRAHKQTIHDHLLAMKVQVR
ncbi:hypothetical protein ABZ511_22560 [Nocardia gamkensis]|uniref:hypothetical protein n=1 Tax=Nocardia gamkensis TaxID=352869 RepID=UPI0033D7330D